jgi:adenylate kinase family enzyme
MRITLVGMPGSGKTTLGKKLAGLGLHYISSGDLARASGFAGSGAERSGALDPDENKIVSLVRSAVMGKTSYVLDGFPRQPGQAQKVPIDIALFLNMGVGEGIALRRLLNRGRRDDSPSIIYERMRSYKKLTLPLLDQYETAGILRVIDATASPEDVFTRAILSIVESE